MREYTWMKNEHNSLLGYIHLFILSKGVEASVVRETDGRVRPERLLYWPITSLDHSMLCYLKDPLSTSSTSPPGLLNPRPGMGHMSQRARSQWLQAGFDSALTDSNSQLETAQLEAAALSRALPLTAIGSHSCLHFTNWLSCRGHLYILFHNAHLHLIRSRDLLSLIYTGASLIDNSVKGQYIAVVVRVPSMGKIELFSLLQGIIIHIK